MNPRLATPEQSTQPSWQPWRFISGRVVAATVSVALLSMPEVSDPTGPLLPKSPTIAVPKDCGPPPDTAEGWSDLMRNVKGWNTGDGITSVRLPNGTIIISGGDNMTTDSSGNNRFRRNALLSVCGEKAKTLIRDGEAIPSVNDQWYWPGEMVVNEAAGKLYVFANRMAKTKEPEPGIIDLDSYTGAGVDLAVLSVPRSSDKDPKFLYMAKTPASNNPEVDSDGIRRGKQWGASVVQGPDGYLYVYGSLMETRPFNFGRDAYVARVPLKQLESPEAWEYFSKNGWTGDESAAVPVITSTDQQPGLDAAWTTAFTKATSPTNGRYTMVSKRNGILGTELIEWSSASPTGPFTERKLADLPPYNAQQAATYNAHIHPAITLKYGNWLVSVCQGSKGGETDMTDNPARYRPLWLQFPSSAG